MFTCAFIELNKLVVLFEIKKIFLLMVEVLVLWWFFKFKFIVEFT